MYKVSVIVPVYNVEKYISSCIESILDQSYKNIELIIVNDGSTDRSEEICKKYLVDQRVIYISKENGGVSSARNKGIETSTGDYIMFVDSDDYIERNMIEEMIREVSDDQTVFCGYNERFINNTIPIKIEEKKVLSNNEIIDSLFKYRAVSGFLCNKIYNSQIIKNNHIKFDENIKYCEDLLFNVEYLLNINKAVILPKCLYNYRMRKSGVTWEKNEKKLKTILKSLDKIEIILKDKKRDSIEFLYNKLNTYFRIEYKKDYKNILKEYKKIMNSEYISTTRKIKLFIVKNLKVIYYIYMKRKIHKNQLFE